MNQPDELVGRKIELPGHFPTPVYVEAVKPLGHGVALRVRLDSGALEETVLSSEELKNVIDRHAAAPIPAVQWASAEDLRLLVESHRIRLAYAHDPYFAVSLSGIRSLPHQIEAVYGKMLPQPRLRFLLADDPGAGKTIMTGLFVKELKLRGVIERVLIVTPAALTIQWQDELLRFFNEFFLIVNTENDQQQLGNIWQRETQVLTSLDYAKQEGVRERVWAAEWDLVVVDEAHKCSAYTKSRSGRSPEVAKTERYQFMEPFSAQPGTLLLFLTATPHQGNEDRFAHFLHLLDPDVFPEPHKLDDRGTGFRKDVLALGERSPWILRRLKEDLRDFEGRRIFPNRYSTTLSFTLGRDEYGLYERVTSYLNQFLAGGVGRRKHSIALTRTVFQRRLASSSFAIYRSLERRLKRLEELQSELESLPPDGQQRRLLQLAGIVDEERDEDDLSEQERDTLLANVTAAEQLHQLQEEIAALRDLVADAKRVYEAAPDSKLGVLRETLDRAEFKELQDGRGKLLIFSEHRDTMEYLSKHLVARGFRVCNIHGGMNPHERKRAQETFQTEAQICVATEAAGEGINLQFCHLMVNYDLPWNPARLEQRMGRIHRIGQERDVHVFNFVAVQSAEGKPVIEGRILKTLLDKLEEMRAALGSDRVYDVLGQLLALNEVNLADILREAALYPGRLSEYEDRIAQINPERLQEYEEQTGIALARAYVDLPSMRKASLEAEERRLMPEYIERHFLAMAERVGLHVEARADGLWRVPHVPQDLRSETLEAVRRYGPPEIRYNKVTFHKEHLQQDRHLDAVLVSPGHPLYAAVEERFRIRRRELLGAMAAFVDSDSSQAYFLHFFESSIVGDYPRENTTIHGEVVCVRQQGTEFELVPPEVVHDLAPLEESTYRPQIDWRSSEEIVRLRQQLPGRQRLLEERRKQAEIIRQYVDRSLGERMWAAQCRAMDLRARYEGGEKEVALALQEAEREVETLERRQQETPERLRYLEVARPGPVRHLASFLVVPAAQVADLEPLVEDPEAKTRSELLAMDVVMEFERRRGWEPEDVSLLKVGFDIRSLGPPDAATGGREVRRIEVKGRTRGRPVRLTENEWRKARQLRETYWLYVVWDPEAGAHEPALVSNPAEALGPYAREIRQISHYEIPAEAIERAKGGR